MTDQTILDVKSLWKIFNPAGVKLDLNSPEHILKAESKGAVVAVRDVSFSVEQGEIFVIMGLSGSGKSTLIRCILRLVDPTFGSIMAAGQDVTAMSEKALIDFRRNKVAMVFQHYGLLPHRSVLENVTFGLKLRGSKKTEREDKAMEVIERVGLLGWEKRRPDELSGGMQQRVGIARALIQDPDILLMDEPFSGLDPLIRQEMQEELRRLQGEVKKTIVFVTHDLREALLLGDRLAVMKNGTFVQVGDPRNVVANPADEYVRRFVQEERRMIDLAQQH